MSVTAKATPGATLLSPNDHALIMIDEQSQMAFATKSTDAVLLRNNAALVAEAAKLFGVSVVLTTVAEKTFSGPIFDETRQVFPSVEITDRTTMNTWEDPRVAESLNIIGRPRLVLAGLWTSVSIIGPALSALDQGFDVYGIADACGDVSNKAHERPMQRMVHAGVRPIIALQYLPEFQRDWARIATYDQTVHASITHGGSHRLGCEH